MRDDSLIWRDGQADWLPLSQLVVELGLQRPGPTESWSPPPPSPTPVPSLASGASGPSAPVYAGFWRRFAALFIDRLIILSGIVVIGVLLALALPKAMAQSPGADLAVAGIELLFWLVYILVAPLYFALQESSAHQATLGKRALGIKVTTLDGGRLGFMQALARWLAAALSYLTLYIGFLMAAFTERKQALHDMLVGTLVVDRWAFSDQPEKQQQSAPGCLIAGIVLLAVMVPIAGILAAIALPAYQDYTVRAHVAEALASAGPAKLSTQEFVANTDRCPRDAAELQLGPSGSRYVSRLDVGEQDGQCTVEIELAGIPGAGELAGSHIWLALQDNGDWTCRSDARARYLPVRCR